MNILKILLTLTAFSQIHAADESIAASVKRKRGAYEDAVSVPLGIDAEAVKIDLTKRIRSSKIDKPVKLALQQIINLYWHAGTDDSSFYILGDNKEKMIAAYRIIGQSVKGRNAMTPVPELFYMAEIVTLMMGKERFFNGEFRREHKEQTEAFDNHRNYIKCIQSYIPAWQENINKVEKGKKREGDFYDTWGPHYPSYLKVLNYLAYYSDEPEKSKPFTWDNGHDSFIKKIRSTLNIKRNFPDIVIMPVMCDLTIKDILDTLPDDEQNIWLSGFMVRKDKDGELSCYADGRKMAPHTFFTHDLIHACEYLLSFNTMQFSGEELMEFHTLDYPKILAERKGIIFKRLKLLRQWVNNSTNNDQYKLRLLLAFFITHEFVNNILGNLGIDLPDYRSREPKTVEFYALKNFFLNPYYLDDHFYKPLLPESLIGPLVESKSKRSIFKTFKDTVTLELNDCSAYLLKHCPQSSAVFPFLFPRYYEFDHSNGIYKKHIYERTRKSHEHEFVSIITDRTGKPVDAIVNADRNKKEELVTMLEGILRI